MNIKQKLDYHYRAFDKSQISPDPLQFLHMFDDERDIEAVGFIASVFAYGNVKQIIKTLDKILKAASGSPFEFAVNFGKKDAKKLAGIKHRFYTERDVINFFKLMSRAYGKFGSLRNLFMLNYDPSDRNLKAALSKFSGHFISEGKKTSNGGDISGGMKFMFPLPELGSACKRMNLFLRWMVRKDELDFGLWEGIPAHKLVIPVDTHVARICRELGLTTKKNVNWRMAEEITANLMKYDPADPVKYDFAICHIGMRKMIF
jgi:uncharacterized protein (TIGR02757 family)